MNAQTLPSAEPTPFDPCDALPTGPRSVVLEASAGTGKTHTIASLALRYVAEGHARLPELLLVTFGRAATSELRDRVRARLVDAERLLRTSDARTCGDPVVAQLADCPEPDRVERHQRLVAALTELDAATITTTHGFCEQMLTTLGTLADRDPDATLLPDVATLRDEVVDDLYLRKYAQDPNPRLTVKDARTIARAAVSDPAATLAPVDPPDGWARDAVGLARAVRKELTRRKRAARLVDYDDQLTLLRDALTDPVGGPAAAGRVRARYRVVLVDEFQDTDPVQWQILRTAFHGHTTLILVGDPKQAVYAFRGADVSTYLTAVGEAGDTRSLDRNWRTDAAVVAALAPVLGDTTLGAAQIRVRPVTATHTERRLTGLDPVSLRQVTRAAFADDDQSRPVPVARVRPVVYADVADQVRRVLGEAQLRDDDQWRPVRPGEVAVLTLRRRDVEQVRATLHDAGLPAVGSVLDSVFTSPAARDWQVLLTALTRTGAGGFAAAAALTPFWGWDAHRLGTATTADRDELAATFRSWSRTLAERGVAALVEAMTQRGLDTHLVALPDGPRRLADVRHVGEVLHGVATRERLGPAALLEWLGVRRAQAEADYDDERSRRLETDAEAVQVMTVHAAKGLEFPVVLAPFLWDRYTGGDDLPLRLHDDAGTRVLHVGGTDGPGRAEAVARARAEQAAEDLRLVYVALTRASSAVIAWWAPSTTAACAPLTRLLLAPRDPDGRLAPTVPAPPDGVVTERLAALAAQAPGGLVTDQVVTRPEPVRWTRPDVPPVLLSAAAFRRTVDTAWRRTSYSGLTAAAHDATLTVGPGADDLDADVIGDEPDDEQLVPAAAADPRQDELRAVASPLADLPAGTAFGTFVHAVLERVDTASDDLAVELVRRVTEVGVGPLTDAPPADVADALLPLYRTPLGPLADHRTLAGFAPADRLTELEFELPLADGPTSAPAGTVAGIAALLRHHLAPDDPFHGYADRLTDGSVADDVPLRGYLTGSIDAVLRVVAPGAPPRFVLVDYKTNRLGPFDEPLTCWHYRPEAMVAAMRDAHYPLQLLLYSAALHRYLRWRLPDYDPAAHLGGGLYLFVRGMAGAATPVVAGAPCGVLAWRPPTALVTDLSELLAGGAR